MITSIPIVGPLLAALPPTESLLVQLDSGQRVSVGIHVDRDPITNHTRYHAWARVVTLAGEQVLDAAGQPIVMNFRYSMVQSRIEQLGANTVLVQLARLLLGEPTAGIEWSDDLKRDTSIRTAIAAAARIGPVTNLGSLL